MSDKKLDNLFSELKLRNITLPNRIVRSATYEGLADARGIPQPELADIYCELAKGGVGAIITGFAFVSQAGRSMHKAQCGIDRDDKIAPWKAIVERVREASPDTKLIMQIAHNGRQTRQEMTGERVVGASSKACSYFRQKVAALDEAGIEQVIDDFASAALRAREAGFDGVQIHAAHGYLIHQFLSSWTNNRSDRWGDKALLLEEVIKAVRAKCGDGFPILVKLSAEDDNVPGVRLEDTIETAKRLARLKIDAIEISYGTMEWALNIIRGGVPIDVILRVNPLFNQFPPAVKWIWKRFCYPSYKKKFIGFSENYNLEAALRIKNEVDIPVIVVGGMRSVESMESIVASGIDAISLCRPLICEPDIPNKIRSGIFTRSKCTNCNLCTIHVDSGQPTRCHILKGHAE